MSGAPQFCCDLYWSLRVQISAEAMVYSYLTEDLVSVISSRLNPTEFVNMLVSSLRTGCYYLDSTELAVSSCCCADRFSQKQSTLVLAVVEVVVVNKQVMASKLSD